MNSKRLHIAMLAALCLLLVGLIIGAYGINKALGAQSDKLVTLKAKSRALAQEQLSLQASKKDIKKYAELEKIAKAVVPEDKNQAAAVREIVNIAAANNVKLASITFPASSLGNGSGGTAATTPANSATATLSQLQPVKNIPGVYQLAIIVSGDPNEPVQYTRFINFLSALEHNRRTAQVNTIALQPDPANRNYLTFTLTLNEYIKP